MPMGCRDRPFSVAVSYPPCTIEGIKMVKYGGNLLPGAGPCVLPAETPCGSLPVFGEFGMPSLPVRETVDRYLNGEEDTWVRPYDQIPTSCRNGFCSLGVEHRPFWPYKILANWAFLSCQVSLKYKAERK